VIDLIGYVGVVLLLIGWYFTKTRYEISLYLNLVASVLMLIWALLAKAYPAFFLNFVWFLISLYNLYKEKTERWEESEMSQVWISESESASSSSR